jgi:Peptidogalycan biosysnthesis/recognition
MAVIPINTASEAADFLGPAAEYPASIYSTPGWWEAVELMRPEIDIVYLAVESHDRLGRAVVPAYLYRQGRCNDRYAPNNDMPSGTWPGNACTEPWALLAGCSGLRSEPAYSGAWNRRDATRLLLPAALGYLAALGLNVAMKYFDNTTRLDLSSAAGIDLSAMPLVDFDTHLTLNCDDFDDYLGNLPDPSRRTVRRDLRRYRASGCRTVSSDLSSVLAELASLWDEVEVHHGGSPNLALRQAMLEAQSRAINAQSKVFSSRDEESRAVAISLNYRNDSALCCRLVGVNYAKTMQTGGYFEAMYYAPIRWSIDNGIRHIYFGVDALRAKVTRGAALRPLYALYLGQTGRLPARVDAQMASERSYDRMRTQFIETSREIVTVPAISDVWPIE